MIPRNRIRELREAQKLTQLEVSKILDIDYSTVSRHESCERSVSFEDAKKYVKLFKLTDTYEIYNDPKESQEVSTSVA